MTGWWFGTCFSISVGNVIIPTDEVHHFSEGWRKTTKPFSEEKGKGKGYRRSGTLAWINLHKNTAVAI